MNRSLSAVLAFWIAAASSGCGGEPRFDATSRESIKASMAAMGEGMTEEKRKEFAGAMMTLMVPAMFKAGFGHKPGDPLPTEIDTFKPLHGLTADEIIAKAKAARAAMDARNK